MSVLSNYPPGVADATFDAPPCRCENTCKCQCERRNEPVRYEWSDDDMRYSADGITECGCRVLCRCGAGICYCTPEDLAPADWDYDRYTEEAYREM